MLDVLFHSRMDTQEDDALNIQPPQSQTHTKKDKTHKHKHKKKDHRRGRLLYNAHCKVRVS